MKRFVAGVLACLAVASCGGDNGPTAPATSSGPGVPAALQIVRQHVTMATNVVELSWSGSSPTYRLVIGSNSQMQDVLAVDVSGTSYTWTAPREEKWYYVRVFATGGGQTSASSAEIQVFTVDMRNMIDAVYFRAGPMADTPSNALGNPAAGVWADGTHLQIRVSQAAGDITATNAAQFVSQYSSAVSGAVTATTEVTPEDFRTTSLSQVPLFTIPVRVLNTGCGAGALACAFYGPSPIGSNRSLVNLVTALTNAQRTIAHELGHAYGMGHVKVVNATRAELNFMMNPIYNATGEMTEAERTMVTVVREAGLRAGWTRNQALAAGLVAPYTAGTLQTAVALVNAGVAPSRSGDRCQIVNGPER